MERSAKIRIREKQPEQSSNRTEQQKQPMNNQINFKKEVGLPRLQARLGLAPRSQTVVSLKSSVFIEPGEQVAHQYNIMCPTTGLDGSGVIFEVPPTGAMAKSDELGGNHLTMLVGKNVFKKISRVAIKVSSLDEEKNEDLKQVLGGMIFPMGVLGCG